MTSEITPTVAVLVDEHGLDSFLALAALRPRRALLIHARDRLAEAERLEAVASRRLGAAVDLVEMADDTDPLEAARVHARLPGEVHLHHTGGTGSMASLLCSVHAHATRAASSTSCLDEERRLLRFGDGTTVPLAELVDSEAVDVQTLLDLSGFVLHNAHSDSRARAAGKALVDRLLAELRWEDLPTDRRALGVLRTRLDALRPSEGYLAHDGRWTTFRDGVFFEHLVAALVRRAAPEFEVRTGVRVARDGTRVEVDVLAVGHYRPYVISCTVDDREATVKAKAWEVLSRSRQVIGFTARPILATTLNVSSDIAPHQLSRLTTVDAADPAGGVRVLGIESVRTAALRAPHVAREALELEPRYSSSVTVGGAGSIEADSASGP